MLPYRDSRLTRFALAIFFLLLVGYAYYEAQGILFGPSIRIASGVTQVTEPFITISGQADRISSLSMNGKPIAVTEDGAFSEPYLLAPGYNRITLDAHDKYGRSRSKVIEIVYTPSTDSGQAPEDSETASSTLDAATSTSTP